MVEFNNKDSPLRHEVYVVHNRVSMENPSIFKIENAGENRVMASPGPPEMRFRLQAKIKILIPRPNRGITANRVEIIKVLQEYKYQQYAFLRDDL